MKKEPNYKKVSAALKLAQNGLEIKAVKAEGFMFSFHVLREGRVYHSFDYENFPTGDWGLCMIAMGKEATRALMLAQTGAAKVE